MVTAPSRVESADASQLARWQLWLVEDKTDDLLGDIVEDAVPHPAGPRGAVFKAGKTEDLIAVISAIERRLWDTQFVQDSPDTEMGLFDQANNLELLGCGIPYSGSPPSAIMLF